MPIVQTPDTSPNSVPLNTTVVTTSQELSVTTSSQSFTKAQASNIEFVNSTTANSIVFIKFGRGEAETASSSNFDAVVLPGEHQQLGYENGVTHVSYIGTVATTLYTIER